MARAAGFGVVETVVVAAFVAGGYGTVFAAGSASKYAAVVVHAIACASVMLQLMALVNVRCSLQLKIRRGAAHNDYHILKSLNT